MAASIVDFYEAPFPTPPLTHSSFRLGANSLPAPSSDDLKFSSSPLHSSGSSENDTDEAPTPKDKAGSTINDGKSASGAVALLSNSKTASIGSNSTGSGRKNARITWDLRARTSCASSPRHRFHPYISAGAGSNGGAKPPLIPPLAAFLGQAHIYSSSSSSSPSSAFKKANSLSKAPRSILKALTVKRTPLSPARSIPQPTFISANASSASGSPAFAVAVSTHHHNIITSCFSPGSSPSRKRVPSAPTSATRVPATLAEITKANGGGRLHTISFPDLRAPSTAARQVPQQQQQQGAASTSAISSTANVQGNTMAGMRLALPPTSSGLSLLSGADNTPSPSGNEGGLAPAFEGPSANDADPRMHIISAMRTLAHSLAGPAWQIPEDQAGAAKNGEEMADCFESSPFDFPARNLVDGQSDGMKVPVHLRELEGAYSTIFTYAQIFVQSLASSSSEVDDLDRLFSENAASLLAAVQRDIHNSLNPVPVPECNATAAPEVSPASTKAVRQALLHRSGLSSDANVQQAASSSPPAISSPTFVTSSSPTEALPVPSGKPKRMGRTTAEMRRRRTELNVAEAALQCFGALTSCKRFWVAFQASEVAAVLSLCSRIPHETLLKTPKHRDLLSSFNWVLANTTLPASTLQPILSQLLNASLISMYSSTKTGEKARRVISEGLRCFRNLISICPSSVISFLTTEPNLGALAFFVSYLASPTKALRDNAALLLGGSAYGLTKGWDQASTPEGMEAKSRAEQMVSFELYKHWSQGQLASADAGEGGMTLAMKELMDSITVAVQAEDYTFARLVISSLPVLFGRRFRKMQHKGPHAWLSRALALKNKCPNEGLAYHIVTFCHLTHSWALASKEVAGKAFITEAKEREDIATSAGDDQAAQSLGLERQLERIGKESLWGIGDKALRVIAQNIECISTPWTLEAYRAGKEVQAATGLLISFIYAFTGLVETVCWTGTSQPTNPHLSRDLTKLWEAFVANQLPKLFDSQVEKLHHTGYAALQAMFRAGDEHPKEEGDGALRSFSLDRIVNSRILGRFASQTSQEINLDLILDELVKPADIPSWNAGWVMQERMRVFAMFEQAFLGLKNAHGDSVESQATPSSTLGWIRNEDGYPVLPIGLSNAFRAFLSTLRSATGQEDSHSQAIEIGVQVAKEVMRFIVATVKKVEMPSHMLQELDIAGLRFGLLQHLSELVEQVFGSETLALSQGGQSAQDLLIEAVLASELPEDASNLLSSAYQSLLVSTFQEDATISATSLLAASQKLASLPSSHLRLALWTLLAPHWVYELNEAKVEGREEQTSRTSVLAFLALLPQICDGRPSVKSAEQFKDVLATAVGGDTVRAWHLVQDVATTLVSEGQRATFFEWSLLPIIGMLPYVVDQTSFSEQVNKTVQSVFKRADSPTMDALLEALKSGLSNSLTTPAPLASLLGLRETFLACFKSSEDVIDESQYISIYVAFLGAFQAAFTRNGGVEPPSECSDLLLAGLPQADEATLQAFAKCWNATFGTSDVPLEYTEEVQAALQTLLDDGVELTLPGWPEPEPEVSVEPEIVVMEVDQEALQESSELPMPVSYSSALPVERIEEEAEITIEETPLSSSPQPANTSAITEGGNEADVSHLSATQAVPQPVEVEEEDEEDYNDTTSPVVGDADLSRMVPTLGSPVPSFSQIPDIPDAQSQMPPAEASTSVVPDTVEAANDDRTIQTAEVAREPEGNETSTDIIPETQREVEETQTSRLSESFNESILPRVVRLVPARRSLSPEVVIVQSAKKKLDKGKGRAIQIKSPSTKRMREAEDSDSDDEAVPVVAASRSRNTSMASSDLSRISESSSRSSNSSNKRSRMIVEVVVPYNPNIPRPWLSKESQSGASARSQTESWEKTKSPPKASTSQITNSNKRKYASSDVNQVLKQVNSSSYDIRKPGAGLKKTASLSLTMTKKPSAGLRASASLPNVLQSDRPDEDDEESSGDEVIVSSSPCNKVRDVSDSLSLSRKRKIQQEDDGPLSSSPAAAAHRRRSSFSQSQSSQPLRSAASSSKRSSMMNRDVTGVLADAGEEDMAEILQGLSEGQRRKMAKVLEDTFKKSKKTKRA